MKEYATRVSRTLTERDETVCDMVYSCFYSFRDMFCAIPAPKRSLLESEAVMVENRLHLRKTNDEKSSALCEMLLAGFGKPISLSTLVLTSSGATHAECESWGINSDVRPVRSSL